MIPRWRLTIETKGTEIAPGRTLTEWVVTGDGPAPMLEDLTPPDVKPPPPPPPLPPAEDAAPFVWPPEPSGLQYDPAERYAAIPGPYLMYAAATEFRNPLPGQLRYAGRIQGGRIGVWDVAGYNLWAEPTTAPGLLRRALATARQ